MRISLPFILIISLLLFVMCCSTEYEFKKINVLPEKVTNLVKSYESQGWQLVSQTKIEPTDKVFPRPVGFSGKTYYELLFKKAK